MIIEIDGAKVEFEAKDTPQDGQRLINLLSEYAKNIRVMDKAEKAARTLTLIANTNGVGLGFKVDRAGGHSFALARAVASGVEQANLMSSAHRSFCDYA